MGALSGRGAETLVASGGGVEGGKGRRGDGVACVVEGGIVDQNRPLKARGARQQGGGEVMAMLTERACTCALSQREAVIDCRMRTGVKG